MNGKKTNKKEEVEGLKEVSVMVDLEQMHEADVYVLAGKVEAANQRIGAECTDMMIAFKERFDVPVMIARYQGIKRMVERAEGLLLKTMALAVVISMLSGCGCNVPSASNKASAVEASAQPSGGCANGMCPLRRE